MLQTGWHGETVRQITNRWKGQVESAWFCWDAWIEPMEEHLAFNRYGFFVVLVLALYFTWRAIQEKREDAEITNGDPPDAP